MKVKSSVPQVVSIFKEIQEQPENIMRPLQCARLSLGQWDEYFE